MYSVQRKKEREEYIVNAPIRAAADAGWMRDRRSEKRARGARGGYIKRGFDTLVM